jgi:2-polyprenyl-6-methoxyphenol hydroxylase-like FAD-dependent oxidoreductase
MKDASIRATRPVIVSGRSEAGMLLAWIFASHGFRVINVDKHTVRQNGAVYSLRQTTFNALESIAVGLGAEVRKECRRLRLYPCEPITASVPLFGNDVGQSPGEWSISAERLHATLKKALDARLISGSIEFVEGKLTPRLENGKTTWTIERRTQDILRLNAPSIVCTVEGFNGTTLQLIGVEKAVITPTQYWIVGIVEGSHLGKKAKLSIEHQQAYRTSRLSDGRGRTAIHIQVSEERALELSEESIGDLFRKQVAKASGMQLKHIQIWDIRGPSGLIDSKPKLIRVVGKAAKEASCIRDETIIAGFGDDISASTFQTGGGINTALAETISMASTLVVNLKNVESLQHTVATVNQRLLDFADWFSYSGARMFYPGMDPKFVQTIYYHLLQQWHYQDGCPPPDWQDIHRKMQFWSRLKKTKLSDWKIVYPGRGKFDIRSSEDPAT